MAMNGEEPPIEKKNKKRKTSEAYPILPLPDDLVLNCLARISRLHYPTLSLVSKSFRSLLSSPELYETRSLLGRTESFLYVCLRLPPEFNTTWFILCQSSGNHLLIPIPSLQSRPVHSSNLLAVGSNIYNIGGYVDDAPSSTVSILDCKSHTWCEAPSMLVERSYPLSSVVDGKIYVAGGCEEDYNSSMWMEVFDLKKQTWELVSCPLVERCGSGMNRSAVIDGEIFMFGSKGLGVAYKPKEDKWQRLGAMTNFDVGWQWFYYCVVGNVLYCYSNQDGIKWYNPKIGDWLNLKGWISETVSAADYSRIKLADYGGKMVVLWDRYVPSRGYKNSGYKNKVIWCAVIALERPNNQEIWGKVEWLNPVLKVPKSYQFVCALSATL
ncbi:PREDICTED: F-box/kelch-repeat protein At4g39560-like [Camelina sativa]|uniref:F-box/kelch-repeat protein At4g39560-like n=1 Tax=Camelina sativa TaxID=90675 RepID=A0ABM1QQF3_CAMSA|nr:PREDICTED: F-box/kelch-repeat protein At4g39560-like [Camelina sativa]